MKITSRTAKVLRDLRVLLDFHRGLGISHYPGSAALRRFLDISPEGGGGERAASADGAAGERRQVVKEKARALSTLEAVRRELGDCTRCGLHQGRTRILFGSGNPDADLFVVGEWPSRDDDEQGGLFSGPEGELLARMLQAIHVSLDDVYLASVVKCRATEEQPPAREQVKACRSFLFSQIEVVAPRVICTLGPLAAHTLLRTDTLLIRLRGRVHRFQDIPLVPTFHPSYLLKNPEMKKAAWVDLQLIQRQLGVTAG